LPDDAAHPERLRDGNGTRHCRMQRARSRAARSSGPAWLLRPSRTGRPCRTARLARTAGTPRTARRSRRQGRNWPAWPSGTGRPPRAPGRTGSARTYGSCGPTRRTRAARPGRTARRRRTTRTQRRSRSRGNLPYCYRHGISQLWRRRAAGLVRLCQRRDRGCEMRSARRSSDRTLRP
jgi:hypothetical protein